MLRRFFETIVEQCFEAGLVWGRELDIDSTDVEANASIDSLRPRFAVEAHLTRLFAEAKDWHGLRNFRLRAPRTSTSKPS